MATSEQALILKQVKEMERGAGGFIAVQVLAMDIRGFAHTPNISVEGACARLDLMMVACRELRAGQLIDQLPGRAAPLDFVAVLRQRYGERYSWENAKHGLAQLETFAGMLKAQLQKAQAESEAK